MGEAGTQAIERAADLLVRVVESGGPVGIGELAATSGLPKSTTSRLVGALERQGLLERDAQRGRLRPGPVLLRFAHRADATLVDLADEALRRLAQRSAETVNLGVPAYEAVEHLAQRDSRHFVGVGNWVGRRVP
ncbi:MAG: helix-turn-helix domain-containing protein, partial [Actinomycetota bacterium]|nr:helix-turn-helix domain-containing protein [Actinomycetota bacterium]